jgi:hypothetical protein
MPLHKYLYLTKYEWTRAWIAGGKVPIALASSYLSLNRSGIYTPDETRIHDSPHDVTKIPGVRIGPDANIKNLTVTNNYFNGYRAPDIVNAKYYKEDGLILSFCHTRSRAIAKRLGKVACVKVLDMHALKLSLDEQLQVEGLMDSCRYTDDHQRNHFLKSTEDAWQEEFRLFWPHTTPLLVDIRPKTARFVSL